MANYHVISSIHGIDADGDAWNLVAHDTRPDTDQLSSLVTALAALAGEVESTIDGQILSGTVTIDFPLTAGKASPVANCEAEKGALFTFAPAGTTYAASMFIPTFKPTLFVGDEVDTTDVSVDALLDNLKANWEDKYGHVLTSLKAARKRFRK